MCLEVEVFLTLEIGAAQLVALRGFVRGEGSTMYPPRGYRFLGATNGTGIPVVSLGNPERITGNLIKVTLEVRDTVPLREETTKFEAEELTYEVPLSFLGRLFATIGIFPFHPKIRRPDGQEMPLS
jgi:hypothetical protein